MEDAFLERRRSRANLKRLTGREVRELAFPDGSYSQELIAEARNAGLMCFSVGIIAMESQRSLLLPIKCCNFWRLAPPKFPPAYSVGVRDNTGTATPDRIKSTAGHRGIDPSAHRSRRVAAADVAGASVVLAIDLRGLGDMYREFPKGLSETRYRAWVA